MAPDSQRTLKASACLMRVINHKLFNLSVDTNPYINKRVRSHMHV